MAYNHYNHPYNRVLPHHPYNRVQPQVYVAVLLDSFITARRSREEERLAARMEESAGLGSFKTALDPLLEVYIYMRMLKGYDIV